MRTVKSYIAAFKKIIAHETTPLVRNVCSRCECYFVKVRGFLQPPMEGVVLQTYGHGNWPTILTEMMQLLRQACDNGVIIINITQCTRGTVLPIYAVGKQLQEIGVIAGHDMTVEAALMKLSYILGKNEWSLKEKREVFLPAIVIL